MDMYAEVKDGVVVRVGQRLSGSTTMGRQSLMRHWQSMVVSLS